MDLFKHLPALLVFQLMSVLAFSQTTPHIVVHNALASGQSIRHTSGSTVKYPLNLTKGSMLYLKNKNDKTILIKGGEVLTRKKSEELFKTEKGISATYFAYVAKKMTTKITESQRSFGGVSRGNGAMQALTPLAEEVVYGDSIYFKWTAKPFVETYYFYLLNDDDDIIYQIHSKDTVMWVHSSIFDSNTSEFNWYVTDMEFGEEPETKFRYVQIDSIQVALGSESVLISDTSLNGKIELVSFYLELRWFTKAMDVLHEMGKDSELTGLVLDFHQYINAISKEE